MEYINCYMFCLLSLVCVELFWKEYWWRDRGEQRVGAFDEIGFDHLRCLLTVVCLLGWLTICDNNLGMSEEAYI